MSDINDIIEEHKTDEEDNLIIRKDWNEFRSTGLLWYINTILQIFGWSIIFETDSDGNTVVYPARTKYRGFSEDIIEEDSQVLTKWLRDNADNLLNDVISNSNNNYIDNVEDTNTDNNE